MSKTAINVTVVCLSAVSTEDSCFVISWFRFLFVILSSLVYSSTARSLLDLIRAAFLGGFSQEVPPCITGFLPVKVENVMCFVLLSSRQTRKKRTHTTGTTICGWIQMIWTIWDCLKGKRGPKESRLLLPVRPICEEIVLSMVALSGDELRNLSIHPGVWGQLIITRTQ